MDWMQVIVAALGFVMGWFITRRSMYQTLREYARSANTPMHVDGQFYYIVPEEVFNVMRNQMPTSGVRVEVEPEP